MSKMSPDSTKTTLRMRFLSGERTMYCSRLGVFQISTVARSLFCLSFLIFFFVMKDVYCVLCTAQHIRLVRPLLDDAAGLVQEDALQVHLECLWVVREVECRLLGDFARID